MNAARNIRPGPAQATGDPSGQPDRFGPPSLRLEDGWTMHHLMQPSRLFGANGIRAGADGRIYVAQLSGSRVSAIDPDTAQIEHLEFTGDDIVGPDDLVFDDAGNLFVTEFTENRVSMRKPNGEAHVLAGDIFGSNPITFHDGHLIAGECRAQARIMELDRDGGAPRVILDDIPMTNAFEVGPDGKLYFPVMGANQIWRINLDGTGCEVVAGDLGVPDSVKFDSKGFIISTQVGNGQVLRLDPRTGARTVLAEIGPGLDNSTFVGDRLFVSHMTGSIHEILAPGQLRELNPKGLLWPMGVAAADDGSVYVADGSYAYVAEPGARMQLVGMLFTPGYPGFHRGVCSAGPGSWAVTTSVGEVKVYTPGQHESELLSSGHDVLMGIAATRNGYVFAEAGSGRILMYEAGEVTEILSGLDNPTGVAIDSDGRIYAVESGKGRVIRAGSTGAETIVDDLVLPEGLAVLGNNLFILDVGTRQLVQSALDGGRSKVIATGIPIGAPAGSRKYLGPAGEFSGPMVSFAGIAAGPDGSLYLGADGNGSVIALRPPA